jgi:mRNA interferase RelE/StbE
MLKIVFSKVAEKDLTKIDKFIAQRIFKKIFWLAESSEFINHEQLSAQFKSFYKLRVGEYRVIYTIEKDNTDLILIHMIGHRSEIYKMK